MTINWTTSLTFKSIKKKKKEWTKREKKLNKNGQRLPPTGWWLGKFVIMQILQYSNMRLANVSNLNFCPFFFISSFFFHRLYPEWESWSFILFVSSFLEAYPRNFLRSVWYFLFISFSLLHHFEFDYFFSTTNLFIEMNIKKRERKRKKVCKREGTPMTTLFFYLFFLAIFYVQREYFCRRPLKIISGMPFRLSAFFYNNFSFFFSFYLVIWMRISAFGLKDLYMLRKNANLFDTNNRKSLKSCNEKYAENEDYNIFKLFFFSTPASSHMFSPTILNESKLVVSRNMKIYYNWDKCNRQTSFHWKYTHTKKTQS